MLEQRIVDLMFVGMGVIIACLVMWWLDRPGREPRPAELDVPDFVPPEWGQRHTAG